jgi:hypothetical protein
MTGIPVVELEGAAVGLMNLDRARTIARAALANLERHQLRLNALNIYPVPDGDTGTNLTSTARGIVAALDDSTASTPAAVAEELRKAALLEAKGNSGVIFSQIVRGLADVVGGHEPVDAQVLAAALRAAATCAYQAVEHPVEGTMLTVIREMAEEAELPQVRTLDVADALAAVVRRADEAVARTPELLAVLRQAGVVDAGGAGLAEIFRGVHAELVGAVLPDAPVELEQLYDDAIYHEDSVYRYCTVFVVEGDGLDRDVLHSRLSPLGDSLLVVGDDRLIKVHMHTDTPEDALALGRAVGTVDAERVEIGDMREQASARESWLSRLQRAKAAPPMVTALVAVAAGAGNRALLEGEDASIVIDGGRMMNPSVGEILEAIGAVSSAAVLVLPNNKNVVLAADSAVAESTKDARVIPTVSVPQGVEAAVAFKPGASIEANEEAMRAAIAGVVTGKITVAAQDALVDGLTVVGGDWLGLVDDRAVASGPELWEVVDAVVERAVQDGRELVTVFTSEGAPPREEIVAHLRSAHPSVEANVHSGDQPFYPLLLSAQ